MPRIGVNAPFTLRAIGLRMAMLDCRPTSFHRARGKQRPTKPKAPKLRSPRQGCVLHPPRREELGGQSQESQAPSQSRWLDRQAGTLPPPTQALRLEHRLLLSKRPALGDIPEVNDGREVSPLREEGDREMTDAIVKGTETPITRATWPFTNRPSYAPRTAAGARACPRPRSTTGS
jgi:hypothetical protein